MTTMRLRKVGSDSSLGSLDLVLDKLERAGRETKPPKFERKRGSLNDPHQLGDREKEKKKKGKGKGKEVREKD
jgi:hypothetical protein